MGKLLRFRQEFPSVNRCVYLYAGRLGPMHRQVPKILERYALDWETRCGAGWVEGWSALAAPLSASLMGLLGATRGAVHLTESVEGAVRLLPMGSSRVAFEAPEGPLARAPEWVSLFSQERAVALPAATTDELLAALAQERPGYLVLCHSSPWTGALRTEDELSEIRSHAARLGVEVILDVDRTIGVVPIPPVSSFFAVVGGCSRWLCGGPGSAFVWLRDGAAGLSSPAPLSFVVAEGSVQLIAQVGVGAIREKSMRQTQKIVDGALARGFRVLSPKLSAQRAGTVSLIVPHVKAVFYALRERRYLVDFHPEAGLLVSPHFYTEDHEIDALLSQIDDIIDRRDYERFEGK